MPAKLGKTPINLTIWDSAHVRLDELARVHDPMTKGDIAVVLLYYGLRHARVAIREYLGLAEQQYSDEALGEWAGLPEGVGPTPSPDSPPETP